MHSPKNIEIIVPIIRNGPNGISLFKVLRPVLINPNPIIAPNKKAKKRAIEIFGQERKKPMKNASFTSPKPIHFPLEKSQIKKKKSPAPKPEKRETARTLNDPITKRTKKSGIIKISQTK